MIPRIQAPRVQQRNILLGQFYAPAAPQVGALTAQALMQRAAQQRAAFLNRSQVTQVLDPGLNPMVQRRISEQYGLYDRTWRNVTETIGGVTGALAGLYTGAQTGFMLTGWSANPIAVVGATVIGAITGAITGAQLGRAAGGVLSPTGMVATGEFLRNHLIGISQNPVSGLAAAAGQVGGAYLTAKLPFVNRLGALRMLSTAVGGSLGAQATVGLSDLIMRSSPEERGNTLSMVDTMGNFLDNVSGSTTIKSALYAATSDGNFIDALNRAYGSHEEGFSPIHASDIRKNMGLDLTYFGNLIFDFAGEILSDPSNWNTMKRQRIELEARKQAHSQLQLEQTAIRTQIADGVLKIEDLTPTQQILLNLNASDIGKLSEFFLGKVVEDQNNGRKTVPVEKIYADWKANLLNRGKVSKHMANKWSSLVATLGENVDKELRTFFDTYYHQFLEGMSLDTLNSYKDIIQKSVEAAEVKNTIDGDKKIINKQETFNKAFLNDLNKHGVGLTTQGFNAQKARFLYIKRLDEFDNTLTKVGTAVLNPSLAVMRNLNKIKGWLGEKFSLSNNEYIEVKNVKGGTTFKMRKRDFDAKLEERHKIYQGLWEEIDKGYLEVDSAKTALEDSTTAREARIELRKKISVLVSEGATFEEAYDLVSKEQTLSTTPLDDAKNAYKIESENIINEYLEERAKIEASFGQGSAEQEALAEALSNLEESYIDKLNKAESTILDPVLRTLRSQVMSEINDLAKDFITKRKALEEKQKNLEEYTKKLELIKQGVGDSGFVVVDESLIKQYKERLGQLDITNPTHAVEAEILTQEITLYNILEFRKQQQIALGESATKIGYIKAYSDFAFKALFSRMKYNYVLQGSGAGVLVDLRTTSDQKVSDWLVKNTKLTKDQIEDVIKNHLSGDPLGAISQYEVLSDVQISSFNTLRSELSADDEIIKKTYNELSSSGQAHAAIMDMVVNSPEFIKLRDSLIADFDMFIKDIDHRLNNDVNLTLEQRKILIASKEDIINSISYKAFTRNEFFVNESYRDRVSLDFTEADLVDLIESFDSYGYTPVPEGITRTTEEHDRNSETSKKIGENIDNDIEMLKEFLGFGDGYDYTRITGANARITKKLGDLVNNPYYIIYENLKKLETAIEEGQSQFDSLYDPIKELADKGEISYELYSLLKDRTGNYISPDAFLQLKDPKTGANIGDNVDEETIKDTADTFTSVSGFHIDGTFVSFDTFAQAKEYFNNYRENPNQDFSKVPDVVKKMSAFAQYMTDEHLRQYKYAVELYERTGDVRRFYVDIHKVFDKVKKNFDGTIQTTQYVKTVREAFDNDLVETLDFLDDVFNNGPTKSLDRSKVFVVLNQLKEAGKITAGEESTFNKIGILVRHAKTKQEMVRHFGQKYDFTQGMQETSDTAYRGKFFDTLQALDHLGLFNVEVGVDYAFNSVENLNMEIAKLLRNGRVDRDMLLEILDYIQPMLEDIRTNGVNSKYANLNGLANSLTGNDVTMIRQYLTQFIDKFEGISMHTDLPSNHGKSGKSGEPDLYENARRQGISSQTNDTWEAREQLRRIRTALQRHLSFTKNRNDALKNHVFTSGFLNQHSAEFSDRIARDSIYTIKRNRTLQERAKANSRFNEILYGESSDDRVFMSHQEFEEYKKEYENMTDEEKATSTDPEDVISYDPARITGFSPGGPQTFVVNRLSNALKGATRNKVSKAMGDHKRVVVFDLETTGVDAKTGEIIDVGAIVYEKDENGNLVEVERISDILNIRDPKGLPQNIQDLTGISPSDVEAGVPSGGVLSRLNNFIDGDTAVMGYNVNFDLQFLITKLKEQGITLNINEDTTILDVMDMYRETTSGDSFKLEDLTAEEKIQHDDAHRALSDAEATKAGYDALKDRTDPNSHLNRYDPREVNIYHFLDIFETVHSSGYIRSKDRKLGLFYYNKVEELYKNANPDSSQDFLDVFKSIAETGTEHDKLLTRMLDLAGGDEELKAILGLYYMSDEMEVFGERLTRPTDDDIVAMESGELQGDERLAELKQRRSDEIGSQFTMDIHTLKEFYRNPVTGETDTEALYNHIKSDPNTKFVAIVKSSTDRTRPIFNYTEETVNPYDPVNQAIAHRRFELDRALSIERSEVFMRDNPQVREIVVNSPEELEMYLKEQDAEGELAVGLMSTDTFKNNKSLTTERYKLPPGLDYFYRNIMKVFKSEALVSMQFHWRNMWEIIQKNLHIGRGLADVGLYMDKARKTMELDGMWSQYDAEMYKYKNQILSDIETSNFNNIPDYEVTLAQQLDYLDQVIADPSTKGYSKSRAERTRNQITKILYTDDNIEKLYLINGIYQNIGFDSFIRQVHTRNFTVDLAEQFSRDPYHANTLDIIVYNKLKKRHGNAVTNEMLKEGVDDMLTQMRLVNEFHKSNANNFLSAMEIDKMRGLTEERGQRWDDQMFNYIAFNNPLSQSYMNIGERLERVGRLQNYLMQLELGYTTDEAVADVVKKHFDYSDRSPMETWSTLIFPFISYPTRNLKLWVDMLQDAGSVRILHDLISAMWGSHDEDEDDYTEYAKGQGWVPIKLGGKTSLLKLGSPALDAIKLIEDPVGEMYNRLNPIIRTVTESLRHQTPYSENLGRSLPYYRRIGDIQQSISRYEEGTHTWYESFMPGIFAPLYSNKSNNRAGNMYRNIYKNLYNSKGLARPSVYKDPYQRVKSIQYRIAQRRYSK